MAAISGVEPATAPIRAKGREHKGRTASDAEAPAPRSGRREREGREDYPEEGVRTGMLIDIEV